MNRVYWEVRKYDYKQDEVNTVFEGKKQKAKRLFEKLHKENTNDDIAYVLNRWVAEGYWDGYGWDFEEYEIDRQWEG